MPLTEAIDVVRSESGNGFDPKVVEVLIRRHIELERMAHSEPNMIKLPTHAKIARGTPAVGFEKTAQPEATKTSGLPKLGRALNGSQTTLSVTDLAGLIEKCPEREAVFAVLRSSLREVVPYDDMVVYLRRGDRLFPEWRDGEEFQLLTGPKCPWAPG